MDLTFYICSLGIIPLFASRAVVPIFVSALVARFGHEYVDMLPWVNWLVELDGMQLLAYLPPWLISDESLWILGAAAAAEVAVTKFSETRRLVTWTDSSVKGFAAFGLCFFLVRGSAAELLEILRTQGLSAEYSPGHSFAYIWSFGIGMFVWYVARIRSAIYAFLIDLDDDDDFGLQGILSWAEDGIGFLGVLLVILLPPLALFTSAATILGLILVRIYLEKREEAAKIPCEHCQTPNHPVAVRCYSCGGRRVAIYGVGPLGIANSRKVENVSQHITMLLAGRRCRCCGERFCRRTLDEGCASCGTYPFATPGELDAFLLDIRKRLPRVLAISCLFSAIPLFGIIPGIIYYRLSLIWCLKGYLPGVAGIMTRIGVNLLNMFLLMIQWIPVIGILTLPAMTFSNYLIYDRLLRAQVTRIPEPMLETA